jgi:general secretion pathway protein E
MGISEELYENYQLSIQDEDKDFIYLEGEKEPGLEMEQYLTVLTHKFVKFQKRKAAEQPGKVQEKTVLSAVETLNSSFNLSDSQADLENMDDLVNREPIIQFVNLLFEDAIQKNASDIHIEAFEGSINIRLRLDGVLQEYPSPHKAFYNAIVSRIKLLSGLDIAQRRLPQDGRYNLEKNDESVDFRISTVPTLYGESVVIRILNKRKGLIRIEDLGWEEKEEEKIKDILSLHQGLILVTGPTGSGKSTTLYAFLQELNDGKSKIITIEDPIEYQIHGINQIHVNPDIELTFAAGLRSILRQDPDIMMVGEMRDQETAKIGIQAALTGHLVLSTLHTNDSIAAVNRMMDLGVENYLLAPALKVIIAQRLARKICTDCKTAYQPEKRWIEKFGMENKKTFYHGAGCKTCGNTGYKGRTAIFEVLKISEPIQQAILKGTSAKEIKDIAKSEGFFTLKQDAVSKVLQDFTTLEELSRVVEV